MEKGISILNVLTNSMGRRSGTRPIWRWIEKRKKGERGQADYTNMDDWAFVITLNWLTSPSQDHTELVNKS